MRYREICEADVSDLHGTLSKHYAAASDSQHAADYINGSSRRINNRLIGQGGNLWRRRRDTTTTHGLLDLIKSSPPLQQPLRVFSNTGDWDATAAIVTNTLVTKPFTSTTLDYDFVFRFGSARRDQKNIILQFDLPVGYHQGVYIGHADAMSGNQKEYLLAPKQTWTVVGQKVVRGFTIIELTPVG
jgi:hypothetical protein